MNDVDPEMLENLEMLLDMDVVESHEDWDAIGEQDSDDENEDASDEEA